MTNSSETEPSFGERFVSEAERLGMTLSPAQSDRLRRGSRGQIMVAVERRLPGIPAESLRSLAQRGPEELARELARNNFPQDATDGDGESSATSARSGPALAVGVATAYVVTSLAVVFAPLQGSSLGPGSSFGPSIGLLMLWLLAGIISFPVGLIFAIFRHTRWLGIGMTVGSFLSFVCFSIIAVN